MVLPSITPFLQLTFTKFGLQLTLLPTCRTDLGSGFRAVLELCIPVHASEKENTHMCRQGEGVDEVIVFFWATLLGAVLWRHPTSENSCTTPRPLP